MPAAIGVGATAQDWSSVGPSPLRPQHTPQHAMGGRVSSIAVDPADSAHWLVGFGNGGVWETHTSGASWAPISDSWPTLAIGAVAFAPSNPQIIYTATGEAVGVGFAQAGVGIMKSTDGGQTWTLRGAASFMRASVRRIHVHPANPDLVTAISSRGGFGRDSQESPPTPAPFGVLHSLDGGTTWTRTLNGHATALEIDSTNFANQYAALGDQRVGVWNDAPDAMPNGVYRSTNGGQTWSLVTGPWGESTTQDAAIGRVELAMAPSNPNVLYAAFQIPPDGGTSGTGLLGLYRTDNAWAPVPTWIQVPTDATGTGGYCGPGKCGYTHVLSVHPNDPDMLFAGGGEYGLWRCSNCGGSPIWTETARSHGVHSDHHAFAWAGTRLINGNDGGVWSTTSNGASWENHNVGLSTGMFFSAALHPSDPQFILGGLRDHALAFRTTSNSWTVLPQLPAPREWGEADVAVSASQPGTHWMSAWLYGMISRTTDGGVSAVAADSGIDRTGAAFVHPVKKCPSNDDVFVTGTNRMWRTNAFFSAAIPSWTANGPAHPFPFPDSVMAPGAILAIAFAPTDPTCNTYAYGTRGGQVHLTTNGGTTWADLDAGLALPSRPVNGLAFDPTDPNILYAALSSFDSGTPGKPGHVFKTSNALSATPAWVGISPPIDVPFNVIAVDPRDPLIVYAGTDVGLWRSVDGGASWTRIGTDAGLPNASVYDIQINAGTGRTVVFTYGRGAYVWSRTFIDEPLGTSMPVRAVHLTELRTRVNAIRGRHGLPPFAWSDSMPARGVPVAAAHISQLRTAVSEAYAAAQVPLPVFTDPVLVPRQTPIRAAHINELRAAVLGIE